MKNTTTTTVLNDLTDYMFSVKNISDFNKYRPNINEKKDKKELHTNHVHNKKEIMNIDVKTKYTPIQTDSLFWCLYILKYGFFKYEVDTIHNGFYIEKQEKLKYIEVIQKSKDILKNNKIKPVSEIVDNLANDKYISIKTFIALCIIENKQILLVDGRKIYTNNDKNDNDKNDNDKNDNDKNDNDKVHIVHRNSKTLEHYIELESDVKITDYLDSYYVMDSFTAKLKSISAYTIPELSVIANKLDINLEKIKNDLTGKSKLTKKDIYEILVQQFI